jgi:hypothetical protein
MMLPARFREGLCHHDRWRVDEMLREQPDLLRQDPVRDMDLWRHLFAPDDLVRVGNVCQPACEAVPAEWCSGNTWSGDAIVTTAALCLPASVLLRGATRKEPMSRSEACEAVLGRLRAARIEIVMIVDDGGNGLDCWIDPKPGSYPVYSKGRCPGGRNKKTGLVHRVVWATATTRIDWVRDEEALEVAWAAGAVPERTEIDSRVRTAVKILVALNRKGDRSI